MTRGLWVGSSPSVEQTWGASNPMTAVGDMLVGGTSGVPARLASSTTGYVLTSNGVGVSPTWQAVTAADRNTTSVLTPSAGVVNIDCSLGDYFTLAPTANVTSITFSNLPAAGKGASLMIRFTQDSTARTVAWPASFKWAAAVAGSVSTGSGAKDLIAITTHDQGTTWLATIAKAFG